MLDGRAASTPSGSLGSELGMVPHELVVLALAVLVLVPEVLDGLEEHAAAATSSSALPRPTDSLPRAFLDKVVVSL
jgi:hypothetical protein